MRKSSVKRLNGRVNGIHSEPNSTGTGHSTNSVPAAVAATGTILVHTMMVSAAADKVQQYRMKSAAMSECMELPNVPSRASGTYNMKARRTTITPGSSMNDSSDDLSSRPESVVSQETASATSSFPTRTTTPHPLSKIHKELSDDEDSSSIVVDDEAPTLPCTSSEEGSDSPQFLRTISVQSLPTAPTMPTEISLYEKTLHLLANDVHCQKEIALGKRIGFYRLGKELGAGNFSKVKLGVQVLTKEKVAVKIMEKSKMDQKAQRLLTREIDNMEQLHHPNIIRLFECVETLSKMYLVMEYAGGGELYTYVHDKGKLTEDVAKPIFAQIISAVAHMHSKNIVHRDIKAENVIFSQPGWVKLADFGFSCKFENADSKLSTFCGSPPYAAPELFKDKNYGGTAVDIWALGVLLYFMLVGVTPFRGETVNDLKKNILAGSYSMPEYVSTFAQHIIHRMLEMEPTRRMSVLDVKKTYWLRESKFPESYLQLSMDPNEKELEKNEVERKVWNTLHSYGINQEMIRESIGKGARNAIIGTYRIVLYQCQANEMDKERIKVSEHLMQMAERNRRVHHQRLNERSKTCSIL